MYCPRCGIENDSEQSFCRKCGQSLSSVRRALDGHVDQAITILRNEQNATLHRVRLAVSALLILIALATLITGGWIGFSNVGSAAIVLIITLIFFVQLALKSRRVACLLNPKAEPRTLASNPSATSLLEARTNALHAPAHEAAVSITEQTTIKLNSEDSRQ